MPIRTIVPIQVVDSYSSEFGLALDWFGYVYLRGNQGISVFPPSASGDTAPVRTIIGSNTGLKDVIRTPLAIQSNPPE